MTQTRRPTEGRRPPLACSSLHLNGRGLVQSRRRPTLVLSTSGGGGTDQSQPIPVRGSSIHRSIGNDITINRLMKLNHSLRLWLYFDNSGGELLPVNWTRVGDWLRSVQMTMIGGDWLFMGLIMDWSRQITGFVYGVSIFENRIIPKENARITQD